MALTDPDRTLALNYAAAAARPALLALWQLDEALGRVVSGTTEPMIGQMRLTWWHERLIALDADERVAEPVIAALAETIGSHDVTGDDLAAMIDGWEVLLDPMPLPATALGGYARDRGGKLFALSARILGGVSDPRAGEGWALVDFARRCSDPATAGLALTMAGERLREAKPGKIKPLRILTRIAQNRRIALPTEPSRVAMLRAILG